MVRREDTIDKIPAGRALAGSAASKVDSGGVQLSDSNARCKSWRSKESWI